MPGLREIRGTIASDGPVQWMDPLAHLPVPDTNRDVLRTFPNRVNTGAVVWEEQPALPGVIAFHTRMPERFGDVGWLPNRGLWASGGWCPLPMDASGEVLVADWTVHVRVPADSVGVLAGRTGADLSWSGRADRAPLAVLAHAHVTDVEVSGGTLRFVETGPIQQHPQREVARIVASAWPFVGPPNLVIVEDFDLQRLARPAPGMVFLADRAFRIFPGLERFHRSAVRRAILAAAAPAPDAWTREFIATGLESGLPIPSVKSALGWLAWNPVVDELLYDGTLPYFTDLFNEAHSDAPDWIADASPRIPGRAAALQLDDLAGEGTSAKLAGLMLGGATIENAADLLAIPEDVVASWTAPYAASQNYRAEKGKIVRDAPADAPAETVEFDADGARRPPWFTGTGPSTLEVLGAKNIRVDPDGHVAERELADNRSPPRFTTVVTGWVDDISPSQGTFSVWGELAFRRQNDSRNLYLGALAHDAQDIVSADFGWVRWLGPLVDRRRRQHRFYVLAGPAILDPSFRPTDAGAVAVGGTANYTWDTREEEAVAYEGHRFSVGGGGGFVPGSGEAWASAGLSHTQLLPVAPRFGFALRGKVGWAMGDVEHRLLPLGGADNVRSLPESGFVANERAVGSVEVRWAPLRHASLPLGVGWLDEVQLVPGIDGGVALRDDEVAAGVGVSFGIFAATDFLGAKPELVGVSLGWPLWSTGIAANGPQVYVAFNHAF